MGRGAPLESPPGGCDPARLAEALDAERDTARRLFALYEAAMATRPHIEVARDYYEGLMLTDAATATDVLERLDAALADAGEVLP